MLEDRAFFLILTGFRGKGEKGKSNKDKNKYVFPRRTRHTTVFWVQPLDVVRQWSEQVLLKHQVRRQLYLHKGTPCRVHFQ